MRSFNAHGQWRIRRLDSILLVKVSDTFNAEGIKAYIYQLQGFLPATDKWALIFDMREWQGGTFDCTPLLTDLVERNTRMGCVCRVYIIENDELKRRFIHLFNDPAEEVVGLYFVNNRQQAAEVVERLGFTKDPGEIVRGLAELDHEPLA